MHSGGNASSLPLVGGAPELQLISCLNLVEELLDFLNWMFQ